MSRARPARIAARPRCGWPQPDAGDAAGFTIGETARLCREMYELGRQHAEAELAGQWARVAAPVAGGGPDHAELEERRWGPGGREHFADPRPGDYPGRTAQAEAEPEPELEAG